MAVPDIGNEVLGPRRDVSVRRSSSNVNERIYYAIRKCFPRPLTYKRESFEQTQHSL